MLRIYLRQNKAGVKKESLFKISSKIYVAQ